MSPPLRGGLGIRLIRLFRPPLAGVARGAQAVSGKMVG
jgi:hypothetical protein